MRTQWAAQFLAASELVRRNYTISFTMGNNTPDADLMVLAPSGRQFLVDVKGQSQRGAWLVRNKPSHKSLDLYYILVYLASLVSKGQARKPDQFYVLTRADAPELASTYISNHPNDKNTVPGFGWGDPANFKDDWDRLPK
jgi:hypothetical protein